MRISPNIPAYHIERNSYCLMAYRVLIQMPTKTPGFQTREIATRELFFFFFAKLLNPAQMVDKYRQQEET